MTQPIYGSSLLNTAWKLAGRGSGAGRPALSDLRRATSTAYYALFHQIVRHSALDFLPAATSDELAHIARWYTHAGLLSAAGLVLDAADSARPLVAMRRADRTAVMALRSAAGPAVPPQLVTVMDAFVALQAGRHSADYDASYDPIRAVTINHVQDAESAVRDTRSLWRAGDSPRINRQAAHAAYRTILRLALLRSGGPRGR